jgi:DNA-binding response OmpR family regulator
MKSDVKKILVIEDNEDIIVMIKLMLEMKGYEVFIEMTPANIEGILKKVVPDLIIMDMLLSGSDGREICQSLKMNSPFSSIPVFMISAHPNAKKECLEAGADCFLAKPFEIKEFYETVENSLEKIQTA